MVVGVLKGFEKRLQLVRCQISFNGRRQHPGMTIPDDLKVKVKENTRIIVSGYDKSNIGQFAASVRKWRPPEPYKGKGVK
ncbi:hypothetical protein V6N11_021204 [Hibiscus sabdariffa]|uniref:Large ribosomal subunit protein uL6 alpha-beta domain-containing protein n=1 Tax=Hibiscus sabdariffa TaxID=183260 RepID=A0ABR2NM86_9ROSI